MSDQYPIMNETLRRHFAKANYCPECGGALDTGWECNDCGYDAMDLAYPPRQRRLDERYPA